MCAAYRLEIHFVYYGGPADAGTIVIVDPISTNTQLCVGGLGVAGSGPVKFTQGAPTSGLSYTFTSLAS